MAEVLQKINDLSFTVTKDVTTVQSYTLEALQLERDFLTKQITDLNNRITKIDSTVVQAKALGVKTAVDAVGINL